MDFNLPHETVSILHKILGTSILIICLIGLIKQLRKDDDKG